MEGGPGVMDPKKISYDYNQERKDPYKRIGGKGV